MGKKEKDETRKIERERKNLPSASYKLRAAK